tara:strand:- start:11206 stop:11448 length:243 start_codon:yes stop_codon:yes gene_type:complete
MFSKFNATPGLSGIPTTQHGWIYRLTHPQPRPRRSYRRTVLDGRFDTSGIPDFESANKAMLVIGAVTFAIVAVLWWMLLS